jgi:hypothetical protein
MKIKWAERITNEGVLRRVGEKRNIINTLRRGRDRFIGRILRHRPIENGMGGRNIRKEIKGKN